MKRQRAKTLPGFIWQQKRSEFLKDKAGIVGGVTCKVTDPIRPAWLKDESGKRERGRLPEIEKGETLRFTVVRHISRDKKSPKTSLQ